MTKTEEFVKEFLTQEEILDLVPKAQNGDIEARDILVRRNLRLVHTAANRYRNRGHDYEDIAQVGVIGLMKTIDKFDPSFGVRFSTYAVPMIVGEIRRFVRDNRPVKISRSIKDLAYKIHENKLIEHTPEEISKILEIDDIKLIKETIIYIKQGNGKLRSLDEKINDGENKEISLQDQLVHDINGDGWFDHIALREAIDGLKEKEKKIIRLRYFEEKTQAEIAKVMKVTQVQISRLEKKILEKLRKLAEVKEEGSMAVKGDKEKAIKLLAETYLTQKEISRQTGVSTGTIAHLAKEHRPAHITEANKQKRTGARKKKANVSENKSNEIDNSGDGNGEGLLFMRKAGKGKVTLDTETYQSGEFEGPVSEIRNTTEENKFLNLGNSDIAGQHPVTFWGGKGPSLTENLTEVNVDTSPENDEEGVTKQVGQVYFNLDFGFEGTQVDKNEAIEQLKNIINLLEAVQIDRVSVNVKVYNK